MLFNEIIGHDDTRQTLIRAVRHNHVAHAQLFDGPPGGATLALALAFATYVNCENKGPEDACGRCASCVKMSKLAHPDLKVMLPVAGGATSETYLPNWRKLITEHPYRTYEEWFQAVGIKQGNFPVKEVREDLIPKLYLKPYEGEYKIFLIWFPEFLNLESGNALLKVLEEPPAKTLFLLVTNQPEKLLITILSRTQRVAVRAFTDEEVSMHLRQHLNVDEKRARQVAYLADGNLSEAIRLSGEEADRTEDRHAWFADWMRMCYRQDLIALVTQSEEFDKLGKEKQRGLLDYSLNLCRDLFLWKHGARDLLRLPEEERTFVENFGKILEPDFLEHMVSDLNEAAFHIERNVRARMVMLDLSLTFSRLMRQGK
ncbi:DNA polymerase III subunit [Tellurirhabdus rosea]|uniref:DNA polymerase III subunit n=1 Tax=Tellurirhabdus rosea TaxID=2674997 RepID=UPI0022531B69|nr:DNA polymerase III subunit delta [Tellurirhabdus rosea]